MKGIRLILMTLSIFASFQAGANNAYEIMEKVNNRDVGDDYTGNMYLKQITKSGREKVYFLETKSLKENNGRKSLLKFKKPNFMKGSGVLLHNNNSDENLQWLYLSKASRSQPRRIASSEKGQPLFGTDIAYIDIEEKKTEDYTYRLISTDDQNRLIIESVPKVNNYPYSKTISWVNPNTFIEEKIEYYKEDKLIKHFQTLEIKEIDGILTVVNAVVENLETNSKTSLALSELTYNSGLKQSNFTLNALKRDR